MNWKVNTSTFFVSAFILLTVLAAIGKNEKRKKFSIEDAAANINAPALAPLTVTDSPPPGPTLHYPIQDQGDNYDPSTDNSNPMDLKDPSNIKKDVEYDPTTNQYILNETIGDQFYRDPTYMSFDDYLKYQDEKAQTEYWEQHSEEGALLDRKGTVPKVNVNNQLVDRLFRGSTVDIRPNGNIDLTFGANYQNIQNPTLTEQQRKQGGFNFDMNIALNVVGKIGDAMKLTTNYNTQSTFDFENQVKLEYTGSQDQIIKKIEAGNVSLPLTSTLITGGESLFGIKTTMQFGRLTMTSVISQNKAQTQNITVQGGAQLQTFNITSDQYDENRNFLLAQYFKEHFNGASATIPVINSQINITRIEVWVTNRTGATTGTRNIVAFADLGESNPYNDGGTGSVKGTGTKGSLSGLPQQSSNNLYAKLTQATAYSPVNYNIIKGVRSISSVYQTLQTAPFNLQPVQDFESTYARELAPTEYTFQPQLGYILLNQTLNPDDVLAVAYQYTKGGQVYQVGEFAEDVPPNATTPNVLFLKLLKATAARPTIPIWNLMMKNVYSLGAYQINPQGFNLNIFYLDPGGGLRRYIPFGNVNDKPLLGLLGLDRLDNNLDPQPDGVFDFIPNITINPTNGKVIFPVLEPFGKDLLKQFIPADTTAAKQQYIYQVLYDSVKTVALQFPQFDRYSLQGTYKSSVSSDISLGAFNVPQGSVKVTAGGQLLQENVDYTVDYSLGRVKIINQGILNSGVPINISFENNATFGLLTKTLIGTRLDYYINDNLKLGGTLLHLSERPYTDKLSVGDDPISNTIYGFDGNYHTNSGLLTKIINKIPMLSTKDKSTISASGEVAQLIPGHSKVIGKDGVVYIDDFEGTESSYDLKFPFSAWALSSTPQNSLFPEATRINDLSYGYRRARLSWYSIDPLFLQNISSTPANISGNPTEQNNYYTRQIIQTEIFPNQQTQAGVPNNLPTFDLNFEPSIRGPYNFQTSGLGTDPHTGRITLPNVSKNWGGIMRSIDYNDFEAANIEYIEFWVLSPYLYHPPTGAVGDLYIDIGNISEDVLKDSRLFYENGLSPTGDTSGENRTGWGYVPIQPAITHSFATDPSTRIYQDVGYDGLSDKAGTQGNTEVAFDAHYLDTLQRKYGANSAIYKTALADPASDDYKYYLDPTYDAAKAGILDRYKQYNNPDGNSPISSATQAVSSAETNIPETEDLNGDNTLSENEEYFEYKVSLAPTDLAVGKNFVTDEITTPVSDANNKLIGNEVWYQVKIPIEQYTSNIGDIPDFKSIRFIRMYITGFDSPVVLRFGELQFTRDQWRKYDFSLLTPGEYQPTDNNGTTEFNVGSVSLNENSSRQPINYVLPPGVQREQQVGTVSTVLQDESSLQLQVCNLVDGDARAVYKDINLDLRTYKNLQMFTHCESVIGQKPLNYGDLDAFVRLGSDFVDNYYEYSIPLTVSPPGNNNQLSVWPTANNFNISLDALVAAKEARDQAGYSLVTPYVVNLGNGILITVVGNPDLGLVTTAMLGVRNPKKGSLGEVDNDDGQPKCTEIWFDEMSLSGFDEQGGYAAVGRVDAKLADFGSISLSGNLHTAGFGGLEQQLSDRYKDNFYQYSAQGTFQLGKLLPKSVGLQLPMFIGVNNSYSTPQYDPYSTDVLLKQELASYTNPAQRDSVKKAAQTFTSIKSLNFTNVRKINTSKKSKLHFWSIENFNATYTFSQTLNRSPTIASDLLNLNHGELAYAFAGKSVFISPFSKLIGSNKWLKIIKDINVNLLPTNLSVRTDMDRQFGETNLRPIDQYDYVLPTYNKFFTWDRYYGFKFDITKSLNFNFSATTNTRIDEDTGRINTAEKRDSIFRNILNGGRTVHYHHNMGLSYTLPINKIPLFDWIQSTAKYTADYDWVALPQVLDTTFNSDGTIHSVRIGPDPLGNTIANDRNIALSGDFNFRNLYNKWKFLKRYDTKATTPAKKPVGNKKLPKGQKKNNAPKEKPPPLAFIIQPLLSLKKFSVNYTQTNSTSLPGYMYNPSFAGQNLGNTAPGWDFISGYQPNNAWMDRKAAAGWITTDTNLNYQVIQNQSQSLTMKASLEPIKDFNFDINFMKTYVSNSTQYFKDSGGQFLHLDPQEFGSYTISFIAWKTSFVRPNSLGFSPLFTTFQNNRAIISQRLQKTNPNSVGTFQPTSADSSGLPAAYYNQFAKGYGPYSQDVLIPAFIAAYTGKSPYNVSIGNLFTGFPMPNFHLSYNGLSKLEAIKKYFTAFTVSSGYASTFSISTYNSALNFEGNTGTVVPIPSKIDSTSGNFIDYYNIPVINISEQFSPLIGIDATWRSGISTKFEYAKSRNLSMSFVNYQLAETRTSTVVTAVGYKWKNAPIPFKIRGKKRRLKNDLNMQCGVNYSYNVTSNYQLDQPVVTPTQGITTLDISPSVDYMISSKLNIRFFFDKRFSIPATSASYPIRYTNAGITIRFTLAQ